MQVIPNFIKDKEIQQDLKNTFMVTNLITTIKQVAHTDDFMFTHGFGGDR